MMPRGIVISALVLSALLVGAIAGPTRSADGTRAESDPLCDPLVPSYCMMPFPNTYYLTPNASTSSGFSSAIPRDAMPRGLTQGYVNPASFNKRDGASVASPLLAYIAGVDQNASAIPTWLNITKSMDAGCPSLLVEISATGQATLLPHWGELDIRAESPTRSALLLYPTKSLKPVTQYVVAYRNLKTSTGAVIQPTEAFMAVRDNLPFANVSMARRTHFEGIFKALATAGVNTTDLILAWDFWTASDDDTFGRMLAMREDALSRVPKTGPKYYFTNITDAPSNWTTRRVQGLIEVPLYLTTALPHISARLVLDGADMPVFQGWTNASFTLQLPKSLVDEGKRGPSMNYGHGLFGSQEECTNEYLQMLGYNNGWLVGGVDWWGMASPDEKIVAEIISVDLAAFEYVPDRLSQSIVNHMYYTELLMSSNFARDPVMMPSGVPIVDTTIQYYNGNSQGGIMGSVVMAVSPKIQRGVLGVAGGPYSLLLLRSEDFKDIYFLMRISYPDELDIVTILVLLQMIWDRCAPGPYMARSALNPLPNTPAKQVLIHYALGDAQVSWLAGQTMGRTMEASMFPNNVQERQEVLYGYPVVTGPQTGPIIVGWSFGVPDVPLGDVPPNSTTDTHHGPRLDPVAQGQLQTFLNTGKIVDVCGGKGCYNQTYPGFKP